MTWERKACRRNLRREMERQNIPSIFPLMSLLLPFLPPFTSRFLPVAMSNQIASPSPPSPTTSTSSPCCTILHRAPSLPSTEGRSRVQRTVPPWEERRAMSREEDAQRKRRILVSPKCGSRTEEDEGEGGSTTLWKDGEDRGE